jgi:hypothetical protein
LTSNNHVFINENIHSTTVLRLVVLLDDCYYTLYYCVEVHNRRGSGGKTQKVQAICPPHVYFTSVISDPTSGTVVGTGGSSSEPVTNKLDEVLAQYIRRNFTKRGLHGLCRVWGTLLPPVILSDSGSNSGGDTVGSQQRKVHHTAKSSAGTSAAAAAVHIGNKSSANNKSNPLLLLHYARWRESVCLLSALDAIPSAADTSALLRALRPQPAAAPGETRTMKGADPLLPDTLRKWNDGCRVWPCHLYSFATPTWEAVAKLASFGPVLEVGAGTGYWTHMLRTYFPAVQVVAYDKDPPVVQGKGRPNDYHGESRGWTAVLRGGPETSAQHRGHTLFLCYPPPDNAMALLALRSYAGATVCYVGEWQGDSGTKGFETLLSASFRCEEIVPLPNWGDTCYSMMVWKRRTDVAQQQLQQQQQQQQPVPRKRDSVAGGVSGNKNGSNSSNSNSNSNSNGGKKIADHLLPHAAHPFHCSACGTGRREGASTSTSGSSSSSSNSSNSGRSHNSVPEDSKSEAKVVAVAEVRQLYRCRLSYNVYFCSNQCASSAAGREAHLAELAAKCLVTMPPATTTSGTEERQTEGAGSTLKPLIELDQSYYVRVQAPCLE